MLCNIPFQILFMTFGKRRNTLIHLFFCTLLCRLPQTLAKNSTVKFPSNEAGNKKNGSEVTTSSSTTVNTTLSAHDKVSAEREDLKMQIESLKEKNKDLLVNILNYISFASTHLFVTKFTQTKLQPFEGGGYVLANGNDYIFYFSKKYKVITIYGKRIIFREEAEEE